MYPDFASAFACKNFSRGARTCQATAAKNQPIIRISPRIMLTSCETRDMPLSFAISCTLHIISHEKNLKTYFILAPPAPIPPACALFGTCKGVALPATHKPWPPVRHAPENRAKSSGLGAHAPHSPMHRPTTAGALYRACERTSSDRACSTCIRATSCFFLKFGRSEFEKRIGDSSS